MTGARDIQRSILPIPDQRATTTTTFDAKDPDTAFPPITPLRPPAGAPNVLVIMLDDVGFGASSAFGGPVAMPTAERLAAAGLKYTRFHTTAMCSPTRAALLSGRNHQTVGMGGITEMATSAPGTTSIRPNTCAPLAEVLKLNGFSTAQFGKCHEVPVWETGPTGPFDHWPSPGGGFEYFYGFLGAETNQYYPAIYENTIPIEPDRTPEEGYHFMDDMTERAIGWIQTEQAMTPDKPFFVYFAPGATHAPHHVPKEWADKYKGAFDDGWDALRERTFERQKAMGIIPEGTDMTARDAVMPAWDDMPEDLLPVLRRQMEVYAGYLEYADFYVGKLVDSLEQLGILDDTLIYYIIGDNGASPEGTLQGTFSELISINYRGDIESPEFLASKLDDLGGPDAYNHYALGWAHAMCTPLQWTKQIASHWGGTRNPAIVHWPSRVTQGGGIREQFTYITDVAATVLEATGIPEPSTVNGVTQEPLHGTSMVYTFDDTDAAEQHETQYFELLGNRGIYHKGWSAVTIHRYPGLPGITQMTQGFDEDRWELYDGATDWSQAHDVAAQHPEKLAELQRLFLLQADRYNVFPLDDRKAERLNATIAGRPELVTGTTQTLFPSMRRLPENTVLNIKNRSFSVTAEITVPEAGVNGTIVAQGGRFGGWALYALENSLCFCYNVLGVDWYPVRADAKLSAGIHQVRSEFAYDGGGLGKGGTVTLFVDGQQMATGRVGATHPFIFSGDETTDVGAETATTVSGDYDARGSKFTGKIAWVRLDVGDDSHDHLIDPEHVYHVAMRRH
ncbi:arylsulfatase [Microbacterium sp. NPDC056044]|uniref:arylsulfatase n=1 Tax=Microbacterium sp. NPDC056044 TaxID=3345690 RepID=UPI0035D841F4